MPLPTAPSESIDAAHEARFWVKVDKTDDCWIWTAGKFTAGYGTFKVNGKNRLAHRLAYQLMVGDIPDGLLIDHTCYNKLCVNPSHLRPVTNKQNQENQGHLTARNKSGVRGVHWCKSTGKWRAVVGHEGRLVSLGEFIDIAAATAAVVAKRNELFTHNDLDRS